LAAEPDSFLSRPGELVENQGGLTELLLLTADGRKREVLLNASRVAGTDPGAHPTYLVLARDVTEYKTMERQLFHSEKLASLGMLAAGVAHEVNNPLSTISGYAQLLSSGPTSPQDTQEYLNAILEQADRIQKIVDALRDYSRPAAGYRTRVRMAETLPRTLAMFTHQKTFGRLKVEYDLDSQAEPVIMDPDHLAQVVVNVAVNAAQAMPKGGRLRVSLRMEGDEVVLRLADNGPGVPPEIRAKIFDPFFTTKPAGRGTGLGLAICQRILEQYGGSLGLEESSSPGATFVLRLPAAPPVPGE
jgi:signal transduction histidine kinase